MKTLRFRKAKWFASNHILIIDSYLITTASKRLQLDQTSHGEVGTPGKGCRWGLTTSATKGLVNWGFEQLSSSLPSLREQSSLLPELYRSAWWTTGANANWRSLGLVTMTQSHHKPSNDGHRRGMFPLLFTTTRHVIRSESWSTIWQWKTLARWGS